MSLVLELWKAYINIIISSVLIMEMDNSNSENPWQLGGLGPWQLSKRVYHAYTAHDISAWAAFLAFSLLLSIFPTFIVLAATSPYLHITPGQVLDLIARFMPVEALTLLRGTVEQILTDKNPGLLSFSLFLALWSASSGILAIVRALNHAYEVREDRGFIHLRLTALFLLLTAGSIIFLNLILIATGHLIRLWLIEYVLGGTIWAVIWEVVRWTVQIILAFFMMSLIYYFGPAAKKRWDWITPGSFIAVMLWFVISLAFSLYVQNFNSYSSTYGSLGTVIVLMFWLQYTGLAIMLGGEIDAQIHKAARERRVKQVAWSRPLAGEG